MNVLNALNELNDCFVYLSNDFSRFITESTDFANESRSDPNE
jgi:hypothetical protein